MFIDRARPSLLNFSVMAESGKDLEARLRQRLDELKITQADLARAVRVLPQSLTNWMTRGSIPAKKLLEVCAVLHCRPEWLLNGTPPIEGGTGDAGARYSSMTIAAYDDAEALDSKRYAKLRVIDAELSAGGGHHNGDLQYEHKPLPFLRSTLREAGVQEENAMIVRVIGNSMEPVLSPNDTVGVDVGSTHPIRNGAAYALRDIDMIRIKLLYVRPGGGLRIRSYNRDEYPDEDLTAEQVAERITIIGRVFWSSKMW